MDEHAQSGGLLTDEIHDAVGHAQRAGRLDTPAELNDVGAELPSRQLGRVGHAVLLLLQPGKVLLRQVDEAGPDVLPDQIPALLVLALSGSLDLQAAEAKAKIHNRLAAVGLAVGFGVQAIAHAAGAREGPDSGIVLLYLIVARDAQVDTALADKGGDVCGGEEDEGERQVLDEGDVEAVLASKLDVGALEEVQAGLEEATLLLAEKGSACAASRRANRSEGCGRHTLGNCKEQTAF